MSTVSIDLPPYAKLVWRYGRPVVLVTALLMSIPGEIHLAEVAGWGVVNLFGWAFNVAVLMPICVSVYAACSAVIADVSKRVGLPNRKSAQAGAVAALGLALTAQDVSHLIQQDYMGSSWLLVGAVSAIPPMVAFHMLHMAAAPESTASEIDVEDELEGDDDVAEGKQQRRGRPGLTEAEVTAAVAQLRAAGEKVTPANLGKVLNRSARTSRRYLSEFRQKESAQELASQQSTAGMLPLSI